MSSWHIRAATPDDFDAIVEVWRSVGLSTRPAGRDGRGPFVDQLAKFPDLYLVAEEQDKVIGVVLGTHDHRKGWINRLAVIPARQRSGVATDLLQACEQAMVAQGIEIIAALVEPTSEASALLFEREGYRADVPVRYFRKLRRPDA